MKNKIVIISLMYVGSLFVCQDLFGRFARLNLSDMSYDTFDDRSSASKASSYSYEDDQQKFSFNDAQKSDLRSAGISDDVMEQAETYARKEHKRSKKSGSWFDMGGISSGLSAAMSLAMMFFLKKGYDTYVSPEGRKQFITEAVVTLKEAVKDDEDLKLFITEDGQNAFVDRLFGRAADKMRSEIPSMAEEMLDTVRASELSEEQQQEIQAIKEEIKNKKQEYLVAADGEKEKILGERALAEQALQEKRKEFTLSSVVTDNIMKRLEENENFGKIIDPEKRKEIVVEMVQAFKENLQAKELGREFAQGIAATGVMGAVKSWWNG